MRCCGLESRDHERERSRVAQGQRHVPRGADHREPEIHNTGGATLNVDDVLLTDTAENWQKRLEAEDVPCAPVLTRTEVIRHPQTLANDTVTEIDHPIAGRLRQARPAPRFSQTPTSFRLPAPILGADSHQILGHIGFSDDEIEQMAEAGITSLGSHGKAHP